MSEKSCREKIASIKKDQARAEEDLSRARKLAAGHRADSSRQLEKITPRTAESMARTYRRSAEASDKKASAEDTKATNAFKKLGQLATALATAEANLAREIDSAARRTASARQADARRQEQDDAKRRQTEKRHAQEIARLSRPTVIHEVQEVPAPKREMLRVLYLTANPAMDLRVDAEVRMVHEQVKAALHRDQIEVSHRPAATPEDLLAGLNDVRPHVVHFSGHAGGAVLVFDNASVETPEGRDVTFELLARALKATTDPPVLLVLNGCDTLDEAEVLLNAVLVVVAMSTQITDLAATNFAAAFYRAVASAQSVRAALEQGAVALDMQGLGEGGTPNFRVRDGVDIDDLVLISLDLE